MLSLALLMILAADPPPARFTLGFVGDVSFAGRSDEPAAVFAAVRVALSLPDVMVANAEGLLLVQGAPKYGESRLDISASPRYAAAFAGSGIDLLGLANNHSWDAGARGVLENLGHLAGLTLFGADADEHDAYHARRVQAEAGCLSFVPATIKSNRRPEAGAFVAFYGPGGRDVARLSELVSHERAAGCAPIVSIHWGREGKAMPDDAVVTLGHALVDAGAALVVGHHPHVLQGVELRVAAHGRAAIAWSLGNFVFKNRDADKRRTGMLAVAVTRAGNHTEVAEVALLPMTIDTKTFAPRPASEREIDDHLRVMRDRSAAFGTTVERVGDRLVMRATGW